MADPRHALGAAAEHLVERWLTGAGWIVMDRRRRPTGGGEVDLLAQDPDGVLVAIEVRARRSGRAGSAAGSVSARHVTRLRRSLGLLASENGIRARGMRVDLVSVEPAGGVPGAWRVTRTPGVG